MATRLASTFASSAAGLCVAVLAPLGAAEASTIYVQDFNDLTSFEGAVVIGPGSNEATSDKYVPTYYYAINNAFNWTFSGNSALLAVGGSNDGAVLLNEPSGQAQFVSASLVGLDPNTQYLLTFNYWGDNRPGLPWALNVNANGTNLNLQGHDQTAGTNPGSLASLLFTSDLSGAVTLLFTQGNLSQASPIFDNVTISSVPLPAALPLFVGALGAAGFVGRRRRPRGAA